MAWAFSSSWNPTRLMEVAGSVDTSTGATEVTTDAGRAYIKPLGNRQGPHVLATDWVGTLLARWFGLSTFEISLLPLDADDSFELPHGHTAQPGPAFATKAVAGEPWDRSSDQLDLLTNPEDISRLIVFDTWTLNCDRHDGRPDGRWPKYDNVFLSTEGIEVGRRKLIAMDHGLCFIRSGEDLSPRLSHIDKVKEGYLYGLFREFHGKLRASTIDDCAARLLEMDLATAEEVVQTVPAEWDVTSEARKAWSELIYRRAGFVADNVQEWIETAAPWFGAAGE